MASTAAERVLLDVQKQWGPDVVFLSEMHLNIAKAEKLRRKLRMDRVEVQESNGASGGLLLFWRNPATIQFRDKSKNFIDVIVGDGTNELWRFTGFYGEPKWEEKHLSLACLRDLHLRINLPWMVVGDFNEILYSHEKEGGAPRSLHMMQKRLKRTCSRSWTVWPSGSRDGRPSLSCCQAGLSLSGQRSLP